MIVTVESGGRARLSPRNAVWTVREAGGVGIFLRGEDLIAAIMSLKLYVVAGSLQQCTRRCMEELSWVSWYIMLFFHLRTVVLNPGALILGQRA